MSRHQVDDIGNIVLSSIGIAPVALCFVHDRRLRQNDVNCVDVSLISSGLYFKYIVKRHVCAGPSAVVCVRDLSTL